MTGKGSARAALIIASVGVLLMPTLAAANFVWPPALYYYSFTRWWVVAGGLAIETSVYLIWLRLPLRKAVTLSLATNAVSAAIGVFALWPILFYEPGIDLALRMPGAIGLIAIIIIVLNICIEYWVAIRWCGVPRTRTVLWNVVAANLLSFALVVLLVPTWFKL